METVTILPRGRALTRRDPSTKRIDLTLKRSRFESAGCPSYWVVDPEEPALTAWQLRDGEYVEMAHVSGDERFTTDVPYTASFTVAELLV